MRGTEKIPWENIHQVLLECGSIHRPREFCDCVVKKIHQLIPYNQARVLYMDKGLHIIDATLVGVKRWWWDSYMNHYSKLKNRERNTERSTGRKINTHDWLKETSEFSKEYVRPQGLRYSMGFGLTDTEGNLKCVFSLDRTFLQAFSEGERSVMEILYPHLNNLFTNMSYSEGEEKENPAFQLLTPREQEIGRFLCQGKSPADIADFLCISIATVYRHINNMHVKLNVSSRQELILRLMG